VNDGSTDQTADLAQALARTDPRIRVLNQQNLGPARLNETYNAALALANGTLIAVLEGDDWWPEHKLELQVALHTEDVVFSYGAFTLDTPTGQKPGTRPPFQGKVPSSAFLKALLLGRSEMLAVTQMISRNALNAIGGFRQAGSPGAVDMATLLALAQLGGTVEYSPETLGYWRQHAGQATQVRGMNLVEHNLQLALQTLAALPDAHRQLLSLTDDDIRRARRPQLADAALGAMRSALMQRERQPAATFARKVWRYGGTKRKIQATVGMLCATLRTDLEFVFRTLDPAS